MDGQFGPGKINAARGVQGNDSQAAGLGGGADEVEISPTARYLDMYHRLPEVRADKVQAAREAIESGQMDSPEKLSVAIDRMLEDLLTD